jgi:GxxExxY protein
MDSFESIEFAVRRMTREELWNLSEVVRQCAGDAESKADLSCFSSGDLGCSASSCELSSHKANVEEISAIVVDCAYKLHVEAGPGLLETVYEVVLARMLENRGLRVRRQVKVPISLMELEFEEGFRADLIVEDCFLIEIKSVEHLLPVHSKQVNTYLRLLKMPLGLLINYGAGTFKDGVKRIVNQHRDTTLSKLRVNQDED